MAKSSELKGYSDMQRRISMLVNGLPDEIGRALYAEAQIEKTESMKRTPVDLGTLRASHFVRKPQHSGQDTTVTIAVGGPAAPYAIYVHEDLDASHKSGQAKFLESTLRESSKYMAQRVAKRLELQRLAGKS